MRIGHGYDVHRMKKGRKCILCGIEIPHDFGPDGHSDADVPIHALIDAMLGAAALGDIGTHFPPTDMKWKDADSIKLLEDAYALVCARGYKLSNADITIVLEYPKISGFIQQMREKISKILDVTLDAISVKATTEEGLGFTGNRQGISATAVVFLI